MITKIYLFIAKGKLLQLNWLYKLILLVKIIVTDQTLIFLPVLLNACSVLTVRRTGDGVLVSTSEVGGGEELWRWGRQGYTEHTSQTFTTVGLRMNFLYNGRDVRFRSWNSFMNPFISNILHSIFDKMIRGKNKGLCRGVNISTFFWADKQLIKCTFLMDFIK